ncbi:gamma-glutamyltransferase [Acuticoccus sediminis]|uniref:Gamma-glutamyltransferase n=1 Tax=Acuticoccus sediminis TaxID=2184697 RepID=A0A8B2NQM5_9HYPH|nr:gamma-glutamyltransferase family protein [Acuticoccus sediminis]RAI00620.1 gamma-glutamyltransferase [Acuticoccus sediminis]
MNFEDRELYRTGRSTNFGHAAVATSEPLAVQAGLAVLRRGGNAVDAAIATAAVLTVTEPVSNGLGSDAFALIWDGDKLHGLNASGRSPAAWTPERYAGADKIPVNGWGAATVPGAVSAWRALSDKFGALSFGDLLTDAIRIAREGYGVGPITAISWANQVQRFKDSASWRATFMPNGHAPKAGELFKMPGAADALELIAVTGGDAFYQGAIAEEIARQSKAEGGAMTVEDLAAHKADWVDPIEMGAYGVSTHEIPPNGQGIMALIALGLLDRLDLGDDPDGVRALHLEIEAVKLAMADTAAHVADLEHMRISPSDLLDPAYLDERVKLIDPSKAQEPKTGIPQPGGTILLTTADRDGMMVSFIQSNYMGFGSGCVVNKYGVSMQNRGAGFSLDPSSPNIVAPSKRPFHTIIPGFVTKAGGPLMAFGMMGGPIQAQGHAQLVTRMIRFDQPVQAAIDAPRFRCLGGRTVALERHLSAETQAALVAMGHDVQNDAPGVAFGFGGAQAIMRHGEIYAAGSDTRKDGYAGVI